MVRIPYAETNRPVIGAFAPAAGRAPILKPRHAAFEDEAIGVRQERGVTLVDLANELVGSVTSAQDARSILLE